MQNIHVTAPLFIIGLAIRTTNENNQAAIDIPTLWSDFHSQQIKTRIPNLVNDNIYAIYTDYESDFTASYTTIIGCQVHSLASIPSGMVAHTIPSGSYTKIVAQGNLMDNIVLNEWIKIWNTPDYPRAYTSDFEVYGPKAQDPNQAEVEIYLAIQSC
ncbi:MULTISPECIES: GyrI-like domain-containing protein [unclassified Myroides]|uniref:GyrI-like domain-containing protein n=1 Tax=unclassified Myroides TaxID=2642485 RepID=UPI003D2F81BB